MATTTQESGSRWRPAIPLWALASGRAFMALLYGLGLGIVTGIWSALTHMGLTIDRVVAFAIVAAVIREVLDATASRLIMRAKRSQDPEGPTLTVISLICPAVAGFTAAALLASTSILTLTLVTWIFYMVIIITLEKPWNTTLNHEEMMKRGRQVRLMTREHFAEEIQDGRLSFQEIDDEGYYVDEDGNRIEEE
ncbi:MULTISPECIES: hypothetical protein [unclassified Actinomyces]|uniref:hypothetical protein n=1 Tax=unclassified Actinomyces TaxID=2609248 RepID=UPI000D59F6FF|nr:MULTISPECIES: hypothetical protein [unclassified Actinomyces]RAX23166.1 hypothetical protein DRB07_05190 [Actinomyces sp. Z3]